MRRRSVSHLQYCGFLPLTNRPCLSEIVQCSRVEHLFARQRLNAKKTAIIAAAITPRVATPAVSDSVVIPAREPNRTDGSKAARRNRRRRARLAAGPWPVTSCNLTASTAQSRITNRTTAPPRMPPAIARTVARSQASPKALPPELPPPARLSGSGPRANLRHADASSYLRPVIARGVLSHGGIVHPQVGARRVILFPSEQARQPPHALLDLLRPHRAERQPHESVARWLVAVVRVGEERRSGGQHQPALPRPAHQVVGVGVFGQHHAHEEAAVRNESLRGGQFATHRVGHRLPARPVQILEPLDVRFEQTPPQEFCDGGLGWKNRREVRVLGELGDDPDQVSGCDREADADAGAQQLAERAHGDDARRVDVAQQRQILTAVAQLPIWHVLDGREAVLARQLDDLAPLL